MKNAWIILAAALSIGMPSVASADDAKVAPAPESRWSDSAEIVITAPEPAMWKLTKGDSVVWVMGTLSLWPADFEWKQSRFLRHLKGSRQLIVPTSQPLRKRLDPNLPGNQTLQDVVTPDTYQRFASTVRDEGLSMDSYARMQPAWAGYWLTADFLTRHRISSSYYPPAIRQLAVDNHIPIIEIADTSLKSMDEHFNRMDATDAEACLNNYLDNISYYQFEMPPVAAAWAHSDLKMVQQYYRDPSYITCLLNSKRSTASYNAEAANRMTDAIRGALRKPGKVVAVVIITDLLRKGGVLDRLKAEGVEVTAPVE